LDPPLERPLIETEATGLQPRDRQRGLVAVDSPTGPAEASRGLLDAEESAWALRGWQNRRGSDGSEHRLDSDSLELGEECR